MKLSQHQHEVIIFAFEALFARVRYLRDEGRCRAPEDDRFDELFTNIANYEIDADREINGWLDLLYGLAIGLGLDGIYDLFVSYRFGFETPDDPFDVAALIIAACRTLAFLANPSSLFVDEVARELGQALVPFRTLH